MASHGASWAAAPTDGSAMVGREHHGATTEESRLAKDHEIKYVLNKIEGFEGLLLLPGSRTAQLVVDGFPCLTMPQHSEHLQQRTQGANDGTKRRYLWMNPL